MFTWLSANIGTILVLVIVIALVVAISIHLINNKKQGKSSCGAGCSGCAGCAMHGSCHSKQ